MLFRMHYFVSRAINQKGYGVIFSYIADALTLGDGIVYKLCMVYK